MYIRICGKCENPIFKEKNNELTYFKNLKIIKTHFPEYEVRHCEDCLDEMIILFNSIAEKITEMNENQFEYLIERLDTCFQEQKS